MWMKDMKFSIDMIWMTDDGTVVNAAEHLAPDSYPQTFQSSVPARYVLEVPDGFISQNDIHTGEVAKISYRNDKGF
jgi:uncharacterized membrane protein (UPF0127 family)